MMRSRPFPTSVLLTILLYTVLVLALVIFSDRSDKHGALFDRSERLIQQYPDSAFELLRNVKQADEFSLREKARYCLLLTKARDEAGIRHTGDSIITIATDFYSGTSGQYRTPEAWFYRGKVYEDMDLPSRALECYLKALDYEEGSWDYAFWGRLYNQVGMLYADQELYGKATFFFKKASAKYQALNDTIRQARMLAELAKYKVLRDSIGAISSKEAIYQITSHYDSKPIREDLSKKELMLEKRRQEGYLYTFFVGLILFSGLLFYRRWKVLQKNARQVTFLKERISNIKAEKDQELMLVSLQLEKQRLEVCNELIRNEESKRLLAIALLQKSEVYEKFHDRDSVRITSEDWDSLEKLLNKAYNDFTLRLKKLYPAISDTELKACMLTKIEVSANQITRVLKYNSSVLRPRLFKKFFKKEGSTETFVEFIVNF
ncbi:hypothetical protein [uncultured Parabacteroides sp.]|uniref:hypothetical protein n=1 Tax=uncultured Parabacteroides sp. TaxID=512312 RepID=UPI002607BD9E|nr:hypothetical protein [uncultured Parabacteroides sp.]